MGAILSQHLPAPYYVDTLRGSDDAPALQVETLVKARFGGLLHVADARQAFKLEGVGVGAEVAGFDEIGEAEVETAVEVVAFVERRCAERFCAEAVGMGIAGAYDAIGVVVPTCGLVVHVDVASFADREDGAVLVVKEGGDAIVGGIGERTAEDAGVATPHHGTRKRATPHFLEDVVLGLIFLGVLKDAGEGVPSCRLLVEVDRAYGHEERSGVGTEGVNVVERGIGRFGGILHEGEWRGHGTVDFLERRIAEGIEFELLEAVVDVELAEIVAHAESKLTHTLHRAGQREALDVLTLDELHAPYFLHALGDDEVCARLTIHQEVKHAPRQVEIVPYSIVHQLDAAEGGKVGHVEVDHLTGHQSVRAYALQGGRKVDAREILVAAECRAVHGAQGGGHGVFELVLSAGIADEAREVLRIEHAVLHDKIGVVAVYADLHQGVVGLEEGRLAYGFQLLGQGDGRGAAPGEGVGLERAKRTGQRDLGHTRADVEGTIAYGFQPLGKVERKNLGVHVECHAADAAQGGGKTDFRDALTEAKGEVVNHLNAFGDGHFGQRFTSQQQRAAASPDGL